VKIIGFKGDGGLEINQCISATSNQAIRVISIKLSSFSIPSLFQSKLDALQEFR
jgi:hypothetical protein